MEVHDDELRECAPGRLEFIYSTGPEDSQSRTQAISHGGFDNDPATMNDILRNVLGKEPKRPFRKDDLEY